MSGLSIDAKPEQRQHDSYKCEQTVEFHNNLSLVMAAKQNYKNRNWVLHNKVYYATFPLQVNYNRLQCLHFLQNLFLTQYLFILCLSVGAISGPAEVLPGRARL